MLDNIGRGLTFFNWITPLQILIYRYFYGPLYQFRIPDDTSPRAGGVATKTCSTRWRATKRRGP
jgi:hypothetical protein